MTRAYAVTIQDREGVRVRGGSLGTFLVETISVKVHIVRHPEDQFYDNCSIRLVDRYKTSSLSGDEWRYSYVIELSRKGKVVARRTVNNFEFACTFAATAAHMGLFELEMDDHWETLPWEEVPGEGICCHPGCAEVATNVYVMKKLYSKGNWFEKPNEPRGWEAGADGHQRVDGREFCDRHRQRGDGDLDDANSNYIVVKGKGPDGAEVDPEKIRESGFGGIVEV